VNSHDVHTREILAEIERGKAVTQRSLSKRLGIALGLTNLLIRRLVTKGFVKVVNVRPNRVTYLITPAGIAEKARATRDYLEQTLTLYTETRQHIHAGLLAAAKPNGSNGNGTGRLRVVFYGAGEIAEIAYVCLQDTDLELVGVVDDRRTGSFFGTPICSPAALTPSILDGRPFDLVVVTMFSRDEEIQRRLESAGLDDERVRWLG
jgi:DNA-binding MarR family transcriptional regulator